jgi:hypothetical protein
MSSGETAEAPRITQALRLEAIGGPVRLGVASAAKETSLPERPASGDAAAITLEEIIALLQAHFAAADLDGDGLLNAWEIAVFLEARGIPHDEALIAALLQGEQDATPWLGAILEPGSDAPGQEADSADNVAESAPRTFGCNGLRDARSPLELIRALWPLLLMGLVFASWRRMGRM